MATNYGVVSTVHGDAPYATTWILSTTAEGDPTRDVTMAASATATRAFLTRDGVPNNAAWKDSTTQTFKLDVSVGSMDVRARCKVGRTDGTNTIIDEGAFTAYQTLTSAAVYTFSPVSPAWADAEESTANQFFVVFEFNNLDSMNSELVTLLLFNTGGVTDDTYVTVDLEASTRRVMIIS